MLAGPEPQLAGQLEIGATLLLKVASNKQALHFAALLEAKETTMFDLTRISRTTQQYVCMALSVAIVAISLSLGAFAAESAADVGYTVTIEQLS